MKSKVYPVHAAAAARAQIREADYRRMYRESVENNEAFWAEQGQRLDWIRPYTRVKDVSYAREDLHIRWYEDGTLNVSANCIDRHLPERADTVAILWEGDEPGCDRRVTYRELHQEVCRFANVLKKLGVKRGDRVTIYMPMIPEAAFAMLACARIGAIHSVVFGGFSPTALAGRIADSASELVITADEGRRGGKRIPLKANVDEAAMNPQAASLKKVLVVRALGAEISWQEGRDYDYADLASSASTECPPEEMGAEDPLFILYTSGSTGRPKGVLHTSGGYLVYVSLTHQHVFDYQPGEIYWCGADVGWVTGHSYIVYGPLANGATTLMYEGIPNYPDASRVWQVCDKHGVNIFYTAPTAIRALMREGNEPVQRTRRDSLRLLGTVGEPINPEAWEWYYRVVGGQRCPVVDTWWQTETGGVLISPLPGATPLKPGSAAWPLFGIQPAILDEQGRELEGEAEGSLALTDSWPGQMRSVYGDHQRFIDTYFSTFEGKYFTGDGARRDADGYYWITGRVDDVLNVSGHRLGTAEIESALVAHPAVAEAAAVGFPHDLKGQGIYVYVTPLAEVEPDDALREELRQQVRREIGPIAVPDFLQWALALPKTRSGKIMRRILRKIAAGDHGDLGDTSTLADPSAVEDLVSNRLKC